MGKYRIDVSIFLRPINQMPIFLNVSEHIDSQWCFGGSSNHSENFNFSRGIVSSKGISDKDFNMPISVRCLDEFIYVLDSGNNRIKLLNKNGQFVKHIRHRGLDDSSCTAMAAIKLNSTNHLFTINWRSKLLCRYELNNNKINYEAPETLTAHELADPLVQEPIGLAETFSPNLFIIQDKKKLHLCSNTGKIVYESLEVKIKNESNLKNITAFCGHPIRKRLFIADSTGNSTSIYEFGLNWLCDFKLKTILNLANEQEVTEEEEEAHFTFRKYNPQQNSLSTSNSSLNSSISCASSATTATSSTNATLNSLNSLGSLSSKGTYTSLWFDRFTSKLLAAKCDKQKTVIEIYNSETCSYEYAIESSKNEKALRRVTSMCCTDDGRVVCVDLVQNCVKMFRFI